MQFPPIPSFSQPVYLGCQLEYGTLQQKVKCNAENLMDFKWIFLEASEISYRKLRALSTA